MARPIPEGLPEPRNDRWTVTPTVDPRGSINVTRRRMKAPFADTYQGYRERLTQMFRAALSPSISVSRIAATHGIPEELYETCETARMHWAMRGDIRFHLPHAATMAFDRMDDDVRSMTEAEIVHLTEQWRKFYEQDPAAAVQAIAMQYAESLWTPDAHDVLEMAKEMVPETHVDQIEQLLDEVESTAADIFKRRKNQRRLPVDGIPKAETSIELAQKLRDLLHRPSALKLPRSRMDTLTPEERKAMEEAMMSLTERLRDRHSWDRKPTWKWGKAEVVRAEMEENLTIRRLLRKVINLDAGVQIGALHRIYTDQKIFRDTRYAAVGTVLIDASGSMSLDADSIYELVVNCPAVTIATYSGNDSHGIIKIVVEGGKMATDHDDYAPPGGGGNIIDGPALQWLSTQRAPRVWVSDGIVTGCDDFCALNLFEEASATCQAHNIYRVPLLEDARNLVKILNDPRKRRIMLEESWYLEAQRLGGQPGV